jgi:nucleotide-binding universal stress UspA family protein
MDGWINSDIVDGIDDSRSSENALRWAAGEAASHGTTLTIVRVVAPALDIWPLWTPPAAVSDWRQNMGARTIKSCDHLAEPQPDVGVHRAVVLDQPAR